MKVIENSPNDTVSFSVVQKKGGNQINQLINSFFVGMTIIAVITLFIAIFVNERKTPQQSSDNQNVFMDFIMRSLFLVTNVASHFIFY